MYAESKVALESNSLFVCTDLANKADSDSEIATSGLFSQADTYVSFIYVKTHFFPANFFQAASAAAALMLLRICQLTHTV